MQQFKLYYNLIILAVVYTGGRLGLRNAIEITKLDILINNQQLTFEERFCEFCNVPVFEFVNSNLY